MVKVKLGSKLISEPLGDDKMIFGVGLPSAVQCRGTVSVSFAVWSGEMCVMFGGSWWNVRVVSEVYGCFNSMLFMLP